MDDLEITRMQFWLLAQRFLIDQIKPANWTWDEKKLAAYFHDRLFRSGWRPGSDAKRDRDRLMRIYNEIDRPEPVRDADDDLPD